MRLARAVDSHQYLEVYMAVPASGRVMVPLHTRHAEPELRYALEDAGTCGLITDRDPGALPIRSSGSAVHGVVSGLLVRWAAGEETLRAPRHAEGRL